MPLKKRNRNLITTREKKSCCFLSYTYVELVLVQNFDLISILSVQVRQYRETDSVLDEFPFSATMLEIGLEDYFLLHSHVFEFYPCCKTLTRSFPSSQDTERPSMAYWNVDYIQKKIINKI